MPALPVVATAPEYMEQKATIDAMAALAFGLYVHVNPVPFVTGAPRLVKLVTEDLPGVTGGKLAVETDPVEAVAAMLATSRRSARRWGSRPTETNPKAKPPSASGRAQAAGVRAFAPAPPPLRLSCGRPVS